MLIAKAHARNLEFYGSTWIPKFWTYVPVGYFRYRLIGIHIVNLLSWDSDAGTRIGKDAGCDEVLLLAIPLVIDETFGVDDTCT